MNWDDIKLIWCTLTRDNKIRWLFSSQGLAQSQHTKHTYTAMQMSCLEYLGPTLHLKFDIVDKFLHFVSL